MRIRDLQILSAIMAGISLLLLASSFYIWHLPYPDLTQRKIVEWKPPDDFAPPDLQAVKLPPAISEAVNRPLFRHSRRPFDPAQAAVAVAKGEVAPPQPPTAAPPPDFNQLTVKGILLNGKNKLVLIVTPEAPEGTWLASGANVMGWKITELGANGATLSANGQTHELKLYVDNKSN